MITIMPTILLTTTTDNGKNVIGLFIPDDQYKHFLDIITSFQYMLNEANKDDAPLYVSDVETKFNNFLRNIDKKVIGAYEIFGVEHYDFNFIPINKR